MRRRSSNAISACGRENAISTDAFEDQRLAYDTALHPASASRTRAVALARSYENDTVIRAPYTGVVTDKVAQLGEIVSPAAAGGGSTRTGIATIVDMDSLEVDVDVSENYIDRVQAGGDAGVRLDAYPEWDIPASVIAVIPTADQAKGTVKVRIAIGAKDSRFLPQMGARVSFLGLPGAAPHAVRVPPDAVKIAGATGTVLPAQWRRYGRGTPGARGRKNRQWRGRYHVRHFRR